MALRQYAQILGIVLILLGILGLLLGDQDLLGVINIDIVEDLVHILTGGLLAYVGFGRVDAGVARSLVLVLGVVYLLVGVLGFILPTLSGLLPHGYSIFDNLLHLVLGVLSIVVASTSRGGTTAARG